MSEKMWERLDELAASEIKKSVYTKDEVGRKAIDKLQKMFGISTNTIVCYFFEGLNHSNLLSKDEIAKTLLKYRVADSMEEAYKETEIFLQKGIGDTSVGSPSAHCSWEEHETKDKKKLFRLQYHCAPPNPFTGV